MKKIMVLFMLVFTLVGCQTNTKVEMEKCSHLIDARQMYRLFEYSFDKGDEVTTFELKLTYEPKEGFDSVENRVNFMKGIYDDNYSGVNGITYNSKVEGSILTVTVRYDLTNDEASRTLRNSGLFIDDDFASSDELISNLYFNGGCE